MRLVAEIERDAHANVRIVEADSKVLGTDMARLRVENFAITANNVTYALVGEPMGYWNFFPASPQWGILPVWGNAIVESSRNSLLNPGDRLFGLLPMATHFDIEVGTNAESCIIDTSAHRAQMSPFYNQYARLGTRPTPIDTGDLVRAVFWPLLTTAVLIEQMFRTNGWYGADQLIITSGSSKTAIALAWVSAKISPQIKRVAVTSASNLEFVLRTRFYDDVISYNDVAHLPSRGSILVDIAGDAKAREDLCERLGGRLRYCCAVGATRAPLRRQPIRDRLGGPTPTQFFAPSRWDIATAGNIGQFEAELSVLYKQFVAGTHQLFNFELKEGLVAAAEAFRELLAGSAKPSSAIAVTL